MKCPECGAHTCTHALDAMEGYAAHALAMEETVDSLRSRAEAAAAEATHETSLRVQWQARSLAAESERNAARAEVEALREALKEIASCPCEVFITPTCGKCVTCVARRALTPGETL